MKLAFRIPEFLFKPIHPATLGLFRIIVGIVFLYEFSVSWSRFYMTTVIPDSEFRLTYDFFHWVAPMSHEKMVFLWNIMSVMSIFVILGLFSRVAMGMLTLTWTYGWLQCNSVYNNHYYLLSLLGFLLIFTKCENWGSIRNLLWRNHPDKDQAIPNWQIFIFKFQILLVYLFGAFAKVQKDWFNGWPMKMWLPQKSLGPLTDFIHSEGGAMFFSYSGFAFDLIIGPMLFFRKTRLIALPMLITFHISNHFLWNIGVFPWFMLAATSIFFAPEWPQWVLNKIKGVKEDVMAKWKAGKGKLSLSPKKKKWVLAGMGLFFTWQIFMPARQMLYKGDSAWTGEGFFFSWNMMLVDRPYSMRFKVVLPNAEPQWLDLHCYRIDRDWTQYPCDNFKGHMYLRQWQKLGHYPKHYIRYAKFLAQDFKKSGMPEPEIYGYIWRQLNNRPYQLVLDTTVNLVKVPYDDFAGCDLIQPFQDLPYKEQVDVLTDEEMRTFGLK